jgi:superfamily I DNA/RNA helicase
VIAQRIHTVFKHVGVPCYTKTEGSYQPHGILFSTIQSVKGKEFDFVFVYGVSNYPESFHMIPYEEAEGLIFVLHTRARKRIIYLISNDNLQNLESTP